MREIEGAMLHKVVRTQNNNMKKKKNGRRVRLLLLSFDDVSIAIGIYTWILFQILRLVRSSPKSLLLLYENS